MYVLCGAYLPLEEVYKITPADGNMTSPAILW
jgi:hypothetical protein